MRVVRSVRFVPLGPEDDTIKTETVVIEILENVIGVRNLSPDARFLDIGGNSLNLVEVLQKIKEKTGVTPSPRMFFDNAASTAAAISAAIDSQQQGSRSTQSATDQV